jgi:metal-responsive CopG/Arc/MetJ family transcriptional regulator
MPKSEPKVKRMNMNLPSDLHDAFKAATAAQGQNMTDVLMQFIQDYVQKHLPQQLRKGRR